MHFALPIPTSLLLLLLPFQTLSSPTPDPIPGTLAQLNGAIPVPALSLGGAVQGANGNTRVYYQTPDSAIHELVGTSNPATNRVYVDQTLLPPGRARTGTPIVAINPGNTLEQIRLYYVNPEDKIREYYYDRVWRDGTLNTANVTARSGSRYLWAVSAPGPNRLRVGYTAVNGDLSEVAWDGESWNKYTY